MKRRFDGLLIDFYGTISDGDRDAVEAACRRIVETSGLDIAPADFAITWGERFFDIIERSNHESFRTLYECELASLRDTLTYLGIDGAPSPALVADLEAYWADPPVHADALEFLKCVDLPICCVSNADTKPLMTAIEKHGLKFDAVITSEAARCYKPDPAIFRRALDAIGIGPDRVIHIGDSLHSDVSGASKLGITTAWIRRENRIHDIGTSRPNHIVTTLNELLPLLR
ncbi:MAG: HAD family hydrolase [Planctomycetota bacterium]|jgi:2-haloacid dehalogenase/putative hydrolase of the HAD superfamily